MVAGAGLLRRDQIGCWGRKRSRNAVLESIFMGAEYQAINHMLCTSFCCMCSIEFTFPSFVEETHDLTVINIPNAFGAQQKITAITKRVAMSNPNGLLSQKLCHCLRQGRTLNGLL